MLYFWEKPMHLSRLAIARFLVAGGVAAALSMPMSALAAPEHQARGFSDLKVSGQVRAAQVVEEHNKALKNLMQEWRSATGADQAMAEVAGVQTELAPMDTSFIPKDMPHRFLNNRDGPLKILSIYAAADVTCTLTEIRETVPHLSSGDKV